MKRTISFMLAVVLALALPMGVSAERCDENGLQKLKEMITSRIKEAATVMNPASLPAQAVKGEAVTVTFTTPKKGSSYRVDSFGLTGANTALDETSGCYVTTARIDTSKLGRVIILYLITMEDTKSHVYYVGTAGGTVTVKQPQPALVPGVQNLSQQFGAAWLRNFSTNGGPGAELYLSTSELELWGNNRVVTDFDGGITTEGSVQNGSWLQRNKIRFGYTRATNKVWIEVNAAYGYRLEYDAGANTDFNAIQIMLIKGAADTSVRLENVKVNGVLVANVLEGGADFPKWNIEGGIKDCSGGFTAEAELVLTGTQPDDETNKMEISFGNK